MIYKPAIQCNKTPANYMDGSSLSTKQTKQNIWKIRTTKILNIYADGVEIDSLRSSDFYSYNEIVKITPIESLLKRLKNQ